LARHSVGHTSLGSIVPGRAGLVKRPPAGFLRLQPGHSSRWQPTLVPDTRQSAQVRSPLGILAPAGPAQSLRWTRPIGDGGWMSPGPLHSLSPPLGTMLWHQRSSIFAAGC